MKVMLVLIGALMAGTTYAQARTPQPTGPVSPQMAQVLKAPDMQLSVMKQQIAQLQEKQAKQQEEIAHLQSCVATLKKELKEVEHPADPYESAVTVQQKSIYETETDTCL